MLVFSHKQASYIEEGFGHYLLAHVRHCQQTLTRRVKIIREVETSRRNIHFPMPCGIKNLIHGFPNPKSHCAKKLLIEKYAIKILSIHSDHLADLTHFANPA